MLEATRMLAGIRCVCLSAAVLGLAACGSDDEPSFGDGGASGSGGAAGSAGNAGSGGCAEPRAPAIVDCGDGAELCAPIGVEGDAPATTPGAFRGHADPFLSADPNGTLWLAYSWPHVQVGLAPDGTTAYMAAVENHLAKSEDGGATFSFVSGLWPAVKMADPEGSGENGIISSETASIVAMTSGDTVSWYGAHLRYFLRPETGYNPKYGTSWHVRIGAAPSPEALATADETVLAVSTTAAIYQPSAKLDELAGVPIQHCAMLNNPTLFVQGETLYLIVECLAFVGTALDFENSTTRVFATAASGPATSWSWRHVGVLADHALAVELGSETLQQPDVSLASDGTPILVITPAHHDPAKPVGTVGDGCVALELESIDPPLLRRDCEGRVVVRARLEGTSIGACTHHAQSATGLVPHSDVSTDPSGVGWHIHASGLSP